jgi:predicted oxidoreductase
MTRADIVVVGAGVAGLAAAWEAADHGADVLIVDAAAEVGGTAAGAGGGTWIVGSDVQQRSGIRDSIDDAMADWIAFGGPTVDERWMAAYVTRCEREVYRFLCDLGVTWSSELRRHEGNRRARWHRPLGGGRAVMATLGQAVTDTGRARTLLESRLTDFIVEQGRVTGVVVRSATATRQIRASAVIVATGGFCGNKAAIEQWAASGEYGPAGILAGGGKGAQGDAHRLLRELGASMSNESAIWMYPYGTPDPACPGRGLALRGWPREVWINAHGRRFHDEAQRGGFAGTEALLQQPGATCWAVVDAAHVDDVVVADPGYRTGSQVHRTKVRELFDRSPYITRARSVDELAHRLGLDPARVREALGSAAAQGAHGTARTGDSPARSGPFAQDLLAIQYFPLARKNLGGVTTTIDCEVVDTQGRAIPGLFAAGEVAGMAGGHINGSRALEGTMFGPSLFSGRIAGMAAAA